MISLEKVVIGQIEDLKRIALDLETTARLDGDTQSAEAIHNAMARIATHGQVIASAAAIYQPLQRQRGE